MTKKKDPKDLLPSGRPCEYCSRKEEIIKITENYLDTANRKEKPQVVYINELALLLGCDKETIVDWAHKKTKAGELEHPEFYRLENKLEMCQELRLQQRLLGRFSPVGAMFLLKTKHGYIETEKRILGGDTKEPLEIILTEAKHGE